MQENQRMDADKWSHFSTQLPTAAEERMEKGTQATFGVIMLEMCSQMHVHASAGLKYGTVPS